MSIRRKEADVMSFLGRLRALLGDQSGSDRFASDDYRLAAAVLLVEASRADGIVQDSERERIGALLPRLFDLDAETTEDLLAEATRREAEGPQLADLAVPLMRALDESGRRRIVTLLWDVAQVDGRLNEFEETLIWRVASLLGVPDAGRSPPDRSA
jgi:uncharacterized tellurite resistance protein B-like protein